MKKSFLCLLGLGAALMLLPSCATVNKPVVEEIPAAKAVSKTVLQESRVSKAGLKRKVAIARFTNETKYGRGFFVDKNMDQIGKQAGDILAAKLLETEKFILIERADLNKINQELSMEDFGPLKNMADYLIVGSVTEFGRKDQGEVGIFSRTKRQTAISKVHVRLIEVRTGRVIYAEEGEGEAFSEAGTVFGVGGKAGYDSTLNDKALEAAITNLSSNIVENLLDRPWRSYVLGFEEGSIIISGGASQNIMPGDMFSVLKKGKQVKNPQTNTMITLPGKEIATIETQVSVGDTPDSEVSLCRIVRGDLSSYIASGDFSLLYVTESR